MKVHWRRIHSQKNSYAALYAACELAGYTMDQVNTPETDVTCYSLNSIQAPSLYREIQNASCITIAGGPHATACWKDLVEFVDYVIVGEGEWALPALLAYLENGKPGNPPPGVASTDHFCPADRCVVPDAYPSFTRFRGYLEISRGCPYQCGYCQTPRIFGPCMRHRSVSVLEKNAKTLKQVRFVTPNAFAYGSDGIHMRPEKIKRLLSVFSGKEIFFGTFPGEVRPDWVNDGILEVVNTYCTNRKIHIGAQSGSDAVLQRIRRGHTSDDVYKAVECCTDHGFMPIVDIILGLPEEKEEDQRKTLRLASWVTGRGIVHAHRFIPLPGTPLGRLQAGDIIPEAEKLLGSLARAGKVTGSWAVPALRFKTIPANRYKL